MSQRSNSFHSQSLNTCSSIISTQAGQQQSSQPRYPLVVSFRKIPPRDVAATATAASTATAAAVTATRPNMNCRQSNNNCYNINDYEQMMRQRTNTFDTIYISSMRSPMCFSINENYNPIYANNTDLIGAATAAQHHHHIQQQQQQPLIEYSHQKGKWLSEVYAQSSIGTTRHIRTTSEKTSSPSYDHSPPPQDQIYVSPYDSPELSIETRRFQENLNNILKELVFKGETMNFDTHQHRNVERWLSHQNKVTPKFENHGNSMPKSTSMPCFFQT